LIARHIEEIKKAKPPSEQRRGRFSELERMAESEHARNASPTAESLEVERS
jgi:hypothetical protein